MNSNSNEIASLASHTPSRDAEGEGVWLARLMK